MELFRKCFGGGVSAENSSLESAATIENGSSTFNNNYILVVELVHRSIAMCHSVKTQQRVVVEASA